MARWVALLVAFVLGLALGYWMRPVPEERKRVPRSRLSFPVEAVDDGPTGAAVAEAAPVPAGRGTIRGRVLDEHGAPIADALVVAVPRNQRERGPTREAGEVPWQEVSLRSSAALLRWYERTRRTTRTDREGHYQLAGLAAVPHGVRAYRESYKVSRAPGQPRGYVTPDVTIDFTGERWLLLPVDVRTPPGAEVDNVHVLARGPEGSRNARWSPDSPWIEVRPGTYEIHAKAGPRLEYTSETATVRVEEDGDPGSVVLALSGQPGLRVQVTLPRGFTARQLGLWYLRFDGPDPPGHAALRDSGEGAHSHRRQRFWIPGLEPGRYLIGTCHGGGFFTATTVADVGEGITDVTLAVPPPDPAQVVAVRALRPDGRVERHTSVSLLIQTAGLGVGGGGETLRGPDGTIYCAYPWWDSARFGELPAGARYLVTVGARDLGKRRVEFTREPGASVEVRFAEPAMLRVAIRHYATSEHKGTLRVTLHDGVGGSVAWRQPLTPEGTYEHEPLQPGAHRIVIGKTQGAHDRCWPIAARDVEVGPGENEVVVPIPRLYPLEVEVASPGPDLRIILGGDGIERFSLQRGVPPDGIVRFPDLAAGDYKLYFEGKVLPVSVPHRGRFRTP